MKSEHLRKPFELACRTDATVLITGPTGCGKTRLAREIHNRSSRAAKPFVAINLATLHEGTLEAEMFGCERGAFTGADQKRRGRLEFAQGGTVFLDEIGELPLRLQARLLDLLQTKKIVPLGSSTEIKLDVRILAATHRNLEADVEERKFREDLYYRLRVLSLKLSPLCQRTGEFREILSSCLESVCEDQKREIVGLSQDFEKALLNHSWPGNIRELRNLLEASVSACESEELQLEHLPNWFTGLDEGQDSVSLATPISKTPSSSTSELALKIIGRCDITLLNDYRKTIDRFEREFLMNVFQNTGFRLSATARLLKMSKATLLRRVRSHNIDLQRLKYSEREVCV